MNICLPEMAPPECEARHTPGLCRRVQTDATHTLPCRYFKRFNVPELDLLGLPLEEEALSWVHANNTLVVSYAKPTPLLALVRSVAGALHTHITA